MKARLFHPEAIVSSELDILLFPLKCSGSRRLSAFATENRVSLESSTSDFRRWRIVSALQKFWIASSHSLLAMTVETKSRRHRERKRSDPVSFRAVIPGRCESIEPHIYFSEHRCGPMDSGPSRFAAHPGMTIPKGMTPHSRDANRARISVRISPSDNRGRRECRALAAPAATCAV
jgi:hypothetical protein